MIKKSDGTYEVRNYSDRVEILRAELEAARGINQSLTEKLERYRLERQEMKTKNLKERKRP